MAGLPPILADERAAALDFIIIRESTEGLVASRNQTAVENDHLTRDTMMITRPVCERLFDFAFRLAAKREHRRRAGHVTCVDKANVLGSRAFFHTIFSETGRPFSSPVTGAPPTLPASPGPIPPP
jgi:3-isopropylmalate dehydrogenase